VSGQLSGVQPSLPLAKRVTCAFSEELPSLKVSVHPVKREPSLPAKVFDPSRIDAFTIAPVPTMPAQIWLAAAVAGLLPPPPDELPPELPHAVRLRPAANAIAGTAMSFLSSFIVLPSPKAEKPHFTLC